MIKKALLLCAITMACQTDPEIKDVHTEAPKKTEATGTSRLDSRANLNISILIDLSDRIDPVKNPNPTMEYFQRDTGYIASVVGAFNSHVLHKKLILINDRIRTFIDPVPQDPEIVKNLEALKVELDKNNVTRQTLATLPANYTQNATRLYQQAIEDNHYIGSDTWRFFKSSAKDYCIKEGAHNILVILTDGYIYHQNSIIKEGERRSNINKRTFTELGLTSPGWKSIFEEKDLGFYTPSINLEGLKVLVLGLNPYPKNPFEEDVLKAYWEKWLMEMGVDENNILIKRADLPVNLDESIEEFILSEVK